MPESKLLHALTLSVRWSDMDALGHVNNAVYFTYFEQTRVEWLQRHGIGVVSEESIGPRQGPVIIETSCTYQAPVVYPATIEIRMYAGAIGRSSFETRYEISDAADPSRLYTTGSAKIVWVDHGAGRSMPIPEPIRELLAAEPELG